MATAPLPVYLEGLDKITSAEVNATDLNVTQTVTSNDVQSATGTIATFGSTTLTADTGTVTTLSGANATFSSKTESNIVKATGRVEAPYYIANSYFEGDDLQVINIKGHPSTKLNFADKGQVEFKANVKYAEGIVKSYVEIETLNDSGQHIWSPMPFPEPAITSNSYHLKVGANPSSIKLDFPQAQSLNEVTTISVRLSFMNGIVPLSFSTYVKTGPAGIPTLNGDEFFYFIALNDHYWVMNRYFTQAYTP